MVREGFTRGWNRTPTNVKEAAVRQGHPPNAKKAIWGEKDHKLIGTIDLIHLYAYKYI